MDNVAGHDKYGHFVMFGFYRSAMPSAETARKAAAAEELLAAAVEAMKALQELGHFGDPAVFKLNAAIEKAKVSKIAC